MKEEERKPYIEHYTTWSWNCPGCDLNNSVEMDGDSFPTPLICEGCEKIFTSYDRSI